MTRPNIKIVSASAGSGKTHHLAELLKRELTAGSIRPHAIVATTFTIKAAAELQERVRQHLLKEGRTADAQELAASRIGTVNSVCGRLVSDFAFELGISPDLEVLDEKLQEIVFRRALSRVVGQGRADEMERLTVRFSNQFDWQQPVERIVQLARTNGIAAEELSAFANRSLEELLSGLPAPAKNPKKFEERLRTALEVFVADPAVLADTTKDTRNMLAGARRALVGLEHHVTISWPEWARLAKASTGAKSRDAVAPVAEAAGEYGRHPLFHEDLAKVTRAIYDIARDAYRSYQDYKREWGLIDFVDQEALARKLLAREDVRAALRDEVDIVLVDEFQDTSPLQLAVFLELAAVAKSSVWVGDQKQSIFAFRGADPSLMDAAFKALTTHEPPETLEHSWRSRPDLVETVSEVFWRSFAPHGIPPERVRLKPNLTPEDEPKGLWPVLERWVLEATKNAKKKDDIGRALAVCVRKLLDDETVRVRDGAKGGTRRPRPSDIAVLCRTKKECSRVAVGLVDLGLSAVLPRAGLMTTHEAELVLAGLRWFADQRDTLATATIARIAGYPADGTAWLEAALRTEGEAFKSLEIVKRIDAAREAHPEAGPIAVFDLVVEATGAREFCLAAGNSEERLANLDALRAHALEVVHEREGAAKGCTAAGLASGLAALAANKKDDRAVVGSGDAVVVSTWHKAKGLEWPITVLYDLNDPDKWSAFGVHVESDRDDLDFERPLAERWVRYWIHPFAPNTASSGLHDGVAEHARTKRAKLEAERENLRVMYVGWTRARDRLVFAGAEGALDKANQLAHLVTAKGKLLVGEPVKGRVKWAGVDLECLERRANGEAGERATPKPGAGYTAAGPKVHPAAVVNPSSLAEQGNGKGGKPVTGAVELVSLGAPIGVSGEFDPAVLGSAMHVFLAADRAEYSAERRLAMAERVIAEWNVGTSLAAKDLLRASEQLFGWIARTWPGAVVRREVPIEHRLANGTRVRGVIDLLVEPPTGPVIIDHKTVPGSELRAQVVNYAPQLDAYADALTAAGRSASAKWIHFPLAAQCGRVG